MKAFSYYGGDDLEWPSRSGLTKDEKAAAFDKRRDNHAELFRRKDEFFQDARVELGYSKRLNLTACEAIEKMAWNQSHSGGFGDVYSTLVDLIELAATIVKNIRK